MSNELDLDYLRTRASVTAAKTNGRMRWGLLGVNALMFVVLSSIPILVFAGEKGGGPTLLLLIPFVGWFFTLFLQLSAAALGSAEALNEEDEGGTRSLRRWRLALFIGAVGIWLLTIISTYFIWRGFAMPATSWQYLFYAVLCSLGSFGMMVLGDTKWFQRRNRLTIMRKLLADHMMDELEALDSAKPKRKREDQTAILGDDGEVTVLDNAAQMTTTRK